MTQPVLPRCPHGANPAACPLCFQVNQRKKKAQPPPQRVNVDPQVQKGKVVSAENNPVMATLMARKQAALDAAAAKMNAQPGLAAVALLPSTPPSAAGIKTRDEKAVSQHPGVMGGVTRQEVNPHAMPRIAPQPSEGGEEEPYDVGPQEMAQLEAMYPRRAEIIEQQPVHPEATHRTKSLSGGSRRAVVTKGKPVGS